MDSGGQHPEIEDGGSAALLLAENLSAGVSEGHSPMRQQYSQLTVQDSARLHAGNSYVGHQHNYYASPTPGTIPGSSEPSVKSALAFPEMTLRSDSIAREQAQTCKWLCETSEYKRWRNPAFRPVHHGILWIRGKPGAGKSTIMKYAFKKHREESERHAKLISFFFSARGKNKLERSTEGMYRALLYQIAEDVPRLQAMVEADARQSYYKNGWPLELLKEMFHEAMLCLGRKNTLTCYIDALDECDEDEIRDMLSMLEELGEKTTLDGTSFLVCLASRHYPNIRVNHAEELVLDQLEGHQDDISLYVQRKLKLHDLEDKLALATEIRQRSSGVFLWVVLVVAILNKVYDQGNVHQLHDRLRSMPKSLSELFDDILDRDEANDKVASMIQWTLCAGRRLTALELYFAVLLSTGQGRAAIAPWDRKNVSRQVLRDFILTGSKGFLETSTFPLDGGTEEVRYEFIHESVREYFVEHGLQRLDQSLGEDVVATSHERLATSCMQYVSLSTTAADWEHQHRFPLLRYIRDYGGLYHAEEAESRSLRQDSFCANFPLDDWLLFQIMTQEQKASASQFIDDYVEYQATLLLILVDQKYQNLARRELKNQATPVMASLDRRRNIDAQLGPRGTALHITVGRNDLDSIDLLIDSGADINAQSDSLGSPLQLAVSRNDTDTVRALLAQGADVDTQAANLRDLLQIAVQHDNAGIIELLTAGESKSTMQSEMLGAALHSAASHDKNAAIKALSSRIGCQSAISTQCDGQLRAALSIAVDHENMEAILALLEGGAGRTYGDFNRLLRVAISRHRADIVRLLNDNAFDINSLHGRDGNALHVAVDYGNQSIVKILLDRGARVDALRHDQWENVVSETALHAAVTRQNVELARILLDGGADIHIKRTYKTYNTTSESALHIAVASRNPEMTRLLLSRGAHVDCRYDTAGEDLHFGTALHIAVAYDRLDITCALLNAGADMSALCATSHIFLENAECPYPSSMDVMRRLSLRRDTKSKINTKSIVQSGYGIHGTALHLAAAHCSSEFVASLLDRGADLGSRSLHGESVLEAAMQPRLSEDSAAIRLSVISLLLERSRSVPNIWNAQDVGRALVAAAKTGDDGRTVQLFANFGILDKAPQESLLTALNVAARGGTSENYNFLSTLLPHLPKAAFATPEYDMLIKTAGELQGFRFIQSLIWNENQHEI